VNAQERGEQLFARFVARSDDRRLERVFGTRPGLRVIFTGMTQRFVPEQAQGFDGEIVYELRTAKGATRSWVVRVAGRRATARPGRPRDPQLTIRVALADFVRLAANDLDPGTALMTGRIAMTGDLSVALRLGPMFGLS
jgi:putative sterol carrier protein